MSTLPETVKKHGKDLQDSIQFTSHTPNQNNAKTISNGGGTGQG